MILGVNDKPFADDARRSFARAITVAEEKTGVLRLLRWRDGQSANVELKLAVLGKYSDTAPYDCPKSKEIFEHGCRLIAKKGLGNGQMDEDDWIPTDLNALALLASGKEEYRPMLAAYAKKVAASLHAGGLWTWFYGYGNLFMAEYVLAIGDRSILPELTRTTMEVARGQGKMGTWGHTFARPDGNLNGYGCMNQPGLVLTLSLVLARQAGVSDPALDRAIDKSSRFLRCYVNKGAIPYGDHQPWPWHDDNGKCSSAAVLFDLLADRAAASFFSRMATAAYDEREHGHCGNFFNMLWALPGASRGGPLATGAYLKEQSWYYDLARNWKGGFVYQEIEAGDENKNYTNWDLTGAYLLSFGLPLKSLYVTGRKPCSAPPLNRNEVKAVIAAGRDFYPVSGKNGYDQRKTSELLAGLSSWSPAVRKRSAQALGRREGDFVPALRKLLAGSDRDARYGACEALGCLGSRADAAAPQLRALLDDPDPWMECLACRATVCLGVEARKAGVNDLLAMAARKTLADPREMAQRAVVAALFDPNPDLRQPGILHHSLTDIDRRFLIPAMESLLQNDDALARYGLAPYLSQLTDRDLAVLLPEIVKAVETMAPSDEMFGDGIRLAGLDLLSRLHIREGMPLCVSVMEVDRWNGGERAPKCLEYLNRYGKHAKAVVPRLREIRSKLVDPKQADRWNEMVKLIEKSIAQIESNTNSPALVDLKDFTARAGREQGCSGKHEERKAMRNMRRGSTCTTLAVVVGLMSGIASQASAKPLKVYILAGQSNMQGHVNVSTFDSMADDPKTAPILKEMRNADGTPQVCEKVWISSVGCAGDGWSDVIEKKGKLTAGFGATPEEIGPEFTFGIYMEKLLGEPILIIKTAWGGRSLCTDFRPPSAGPYVWSDFELAKRKATIEKEKADKVKATGVFYRAMIQHVRKVLADIKRVVPEYDPKQGYELAGFVWFQGFNDLVSDWTYHNQMKPGGYDEYAQLLVQFIRGVRKDFSAPKMPFVIGVMGIDGMKQGNRPPQLYFRQAQAAPASLPEFQGNVVAVQTAPYWDDDLAALQERMERLEVKDGRRGQESSQPDP